MVYKSGLFIFLHLFFLDIKKKVGFGEGQNSL